MLKMSAEYMVMQACEPARTYKPFKNLLPHDTRVLGVWVDPADNNDVVVKLESSEWSEVEADSKIPFLPQPWFQVVPL